jgi:hypothetical protein
VLNGFSFYLTNCFSFGWCYSTVVRLADSPLQDWSAPHTIMLKTTTDYKKFFFCKATAQHG